MYKNVQRGFQSLLYSNEAKPLENWIKKVKNGHIKRVTDEELLSLVLEIQGINANQTYIMCPANPQKTLNIKLPFLVMVVKNLGKYFTFDVQFIDDKKVRRRIRASNFQQNTIVKPLLCTMPLCLEKGWNQVELNLMDLAKRIYDSKYVETLRVQIKANCRIRRLYFCDKLNAIDEFSTKKPRS